MVSTVSSRRRWMNTERPSPEMAIGSRRVSAGVRSDVRLRISRDCRFKTKGRGGPPVSAGSPKTAISSPSGKARTLGESVYRTVAGRTWVRPESGQKRSNCSRPSAEWRPVINEPSGHGSVGTVVGKGGPTGGVGSHDGDLRLAVYDGAEGEQLAVRGNAGVGGNDGTAEDCSRPGGRLGRPGSYPNGRGSKNIAKSPAQPGWRSPG